MSGALSSRLALAVSLLRAEGPRALIARWRDRRLDAHRARAFALVGSDGSDRFNRSDRGSIALLPPGERSRTLWVLPFALQRRGGGAAIQLLVQLEQQALAGPVALLQRLPDRLRCELWGRGVARAVAREWPLVGGRSDTLPSIPAAALLPILLDAARWVGAERLHFESVADLPLSLPLVAREHGFPFGVSAHDFALFCPRPHLLEEPGGRFCGFSTDPGRCARCLGVTFRLPEGFQEARRGVAAALVEAADTLEFPSDYMLREHLRLFPGIDRARTRVRPPQSLAEPLTKPPRAVRTPPVRIAFAGAVHRHKGALEFEAVIRNFAAQGRGDLSWHVFGGGDAALLRRLRRLPRTRVHGYFGAGSLPAKLRAAEIDLVVLPSIWPEAHCLVLDECLAAGVPVVAFDLGALGERIRAGGLGGVVDPRAGAPGLVAWISGLG